MRKEKEKTLEHAPTLVIKIRGPLNPLPLPPLFPRSFEYHLIRSCLSRCRCLIRHRPLPPYSALASITHAGLSAMAPLFVLHSQHLPLALALATGATNEDERDSLLALVTVSSQ